MKVVGVKKHHNEHRDSPQSFNVGTKCSVLWRRAALVDKRVTVLPGRNDLVVTRTRAPRRSKGNVHFRSCLSRIGISTRRIRSRHLESFSDFFVCEKWVATQGAIMGMGRHKALRSYLHL